MANIYEQFLTPAAPQGTPTDTAPAPAEAAAGAETAPEQATPEVNVDVQEDKPGLLSRVIHDIGGGLSDAPMQVVGGARDAIQETGDLLKEVPAPGEKSFAALREKMGVAAPTRDETPLPEIGKPDTVTGGLVRGAAQFFTGFLPGLRATKAMTGGKAVTALGKVAQAETAGAAASAVVFDPHDERISNLIESNPALSNPVTEYLQAKPGDTASEGRFKNALEGLGMGAVAEGMFAIFRSFKAGKVAHEAGDTATADAAAKQMDTATEAFVAKESGTATPEQLALFDNLQRQDSPALLTQKAEAPVVKKPQSNLAENRNGIPADTLGTVKERVSTIGESLGLTQNDLANLRLRIGDAGRGDISWDAAISSLPMNVAHWTGPDQAKEAVELIMQEVRQHMPKDFDGVQTMRSVKDLADTFQLRPEETLEGMRQLAGQAESIPARVAATKAITQGLLNRIPDVARAVNAGTAAEEAFDKYVALTLGTIEDLKAVTKMGARVTNIGNLDVGMAQGGVKASQFEAMVTKLSSYQGDKQAFINNLANISDKPNWVMHMLHRVNAHKTWDIINEVWINAILSGPKTHLVNMTSNLTQAIVMPTEQMIGATLRADWRGARGAVSTYAGLFQNFREATAAAGAALRKEDNILDVSHRVQDTTTNTHAIPGKVGEAIRLPGRALLAEDEWFKQVNYRAKVYELAVDEAIERGVSRKATISPDGMKVSEFDRFVEQRMKDAFDDTGAGTVKEALDYAREATFTNDLIPGSLAKRVQDAVVAIPALRQIVPFTRTPTNLIVAAYQRTPVLGMFSKQMKSDWASGNPRLRNKVIGKQAVGTAVLGYASSLAAQGQITGAGPKDENMKRTLEKTGWRPYSIKIGDEYIPYKRMEPFATLFGVVGDMAEIQAELSDRQITEVSDASLLAFMANMGDVNTGDMAGRLTMATVRGISDKTYLKGIFDVLAAVESKDPNKAAAFLRQRAGSMVPFSSLMRQTSTDPYHHEVRTIVDALKANIWWASGTLPKKYNFLGQPEMKQGTWMSRAASPIETSTKTNDELWDSLAKLGSPILPPTDKQGNVNLTEFRNGDGKDAYDRYNELIGQTKLGGRSLEEALRGIVGSKAFKEGMSSGIKSEATGVTYKGDKLTQVRSLVADYRMKAMAELRREGFKNPETNTDLHRAMLNDTVNAGRAKSAKTTLQDLLPVK